jgi:hypothetical protein
MSGLFLTGGSGACQGWTPPGNLFAPTITYLSGTYSPAGGTTLVAIFGTNFKLYSTIKFGSYTPTMIFINSGQIDFYVPASAPYGTYPVQVFNDPYGSNIVNYTIDNSPGFWYLNPSYPDVISNSNTGGLSVNGQITINNNSTTASSDLIFDMKAINSNQSIVWNNTGISPSLTYSNMYVSIANLYLAINTSNNLSNGFKLQYNNMSFFDYTPGAIYPITMTGDTYIYNNLTVSNNITCTTLIQTSDYRIKEVIEPLNVATHSVDNLKPVKYFNKKSEKVEFGFIAHEVQEFFPELVTGEKNGEALQTLNYVGLISILVQEIKELKSEVAQLKCKI